MQSRWGRQEGQFFILSGRWFFISTTERRDG